MAALWTSCFLLLLLSGSPRPLAAQPKRPYRVGGPIPQLIHRHQIGDLLQAERMTTGAELGVQRGKFALITLKAWKACQRYYLIDAWRPLTNYSDVSNAGKQQQEELFRTTQERLAPFATKLVYLRMLTSEAAPLIHNNSLDYVYIDARHDYCGASEDIRNYWPKVRPGGIVAGHDYLFANSPQLEGQDWSLCGDGTRHMGAVKGAVLEFAAAMGVTVRSTTRDKFPSWLIRKPLRPRSPEDLAADRKKIPSQNFPWK
eukprot:EG_transcript_19600